MASYAPGEGFVRVSEVARLYGVSESTVRNWINRGDLKAYRIRPGEAVRISRHDLDALVARQTSRRSSFSEHCRAQ